VIETDSDGRAIVEVSLDPEEGPASTVVRATIPELEHSPFATFVGSGLAAGDPADTAIGGVVLDGTGLPVEGVTARVRGTALSATTDEAGLFRLHPAPVGTVYLDIDGSTASRPGTWPDHEYVVTTVPGREVDVGTPIHLLPLELGSGVFVDESTGASIELPEIPGFRLEIAPGSVTFPGGGRSGLVSATAVHHDRIPMTPNFGQQPRLILTIQPAGARFDPPARLTLPNVENLTPGEVTEMYSFDHDLGHFVSIGPASVSRDGLVIVADEGVGIVKAGWHCGGRPAPGGAPNDCPPCHQCNGSTCVPGCSGSACEQPCRKECRTECSCDDPDGVPIEIGARGLSGLRTCAAIADTGETQICSLVTALELSVSKEVTTLGKIPLVEGMVDESNCDSIVRDIAPIYPEKDSDICNARNGTWVVMDALTSHEDQHEIDFEAMLFELVDQLEQELPAGCDCEVDGEANDLFDAIANPLYAEYMRLTECKAEVAEHGKNVAFLELLEGLAQPHWPLVCRDLGTFTSPNPATCRGWGPTAGPPSCPDGVVP
jgi:hypothetical protein